MAASTVAYTDTTGNKDYLGIIAGQIGRRLKEASDMASDERAYAEGKAGDGGTSLSEAGIGRGYFFRRALGSRFGGDRIARTKGRMGIGGAGTNPTGNVRSRFRGGFDYNVVNQIQQSTLPLSSALVDGLRGVESALLDVSSSLSTIGSGMNDLARSQFVNNQLMQGILTRMQRQQSRQSARGEERSLEGGGGRRMINITPEPTVLGGGFGGGGAGGGRNKVLTGLDTFQTGVKATTNVKGAKQIRSAFNVGKIANKTGKLLKVPGTALRSAFSNINLKNPLAGLKALKDTISAQSGAGLLGFGGKRRQLFNFFNPRFTGTDKLYDPAMDAARRAYGGNLIDNLLGTPADLSQGFADDGTRILNNAFPNVAIPPTSALVGESVPANLKKIMTTGGESTVKTAIKRQAKRFGAKTTTDAAVRGFPAAQRIAQLDDAGVKVADIASDQIVKQGTKEGLKKGSKIARLMVKQFGAAGTRSILKKIPLVAGAAGVLFGIQRAMEGDFLGAGLEITSGLLGATGVGSGLSLGIDGFLLGRDLGVVPMADGGIVQRAIVGEKGPEAVLPLAGARGKKTFKMMGEGTLQARLDNESDDSKLIALGHKKYYEQMGGWKSFGTGLLDAFGDMKDKVGDTLANVNPFSAENLSKVNNSSAANSIRDVIGSDVGDGYLGPKWLGIKNPFADEQANMLNNTSANASLGQMMMSTTVINNNYAVANGGNGDEGSSDSAFPSSFAAFTVPYSLASK